MQPDAFYAIAREARKNEMRFVGHVPDSVTAGEASDAGQASIEHLTGVVLGGSTREEELRQRRLAQVPAGESEEQAHARDRKWTNDLLRSQSEQRTASLCEKFRANRTWQVPTFPTLVHLGFVTPETDLENDPRLKYVSSNLRQIWEQGRRQQLDDRNAEDFALRAGVIQRSLQIVGAMNAAGVPIMAGTDAAAPNVFPGFSLHEDLVYLVKAGLTPMQALESATSRPAEFLARSAEQGTIEAGKRADLVLLDADPLADIRNTQRIRAVVANGRLIDRGELDELLTRVERYAATH